MKLDLEKSARQHLGHLCDQLSGSLLHSDKETLQKNRVYVLGLHPGGDPHDGSSLMGNIQQKNCNAESETSPSQPVRASELLQLLAPQAHKSIPCSNLLFFRSRSVATLQSSAADKSKPLAIHGRAVTNILDLADVCWKVHLEIIKIVQPDLIISLGNSPSFSPIHFIATKYSQEVKEFHGSYKAGKYIAPFTDRHFGDKPVQVYGIAHPSYHAIYEEEKMRLKHILASLNQPLQKAA